jgi:predicted RNA-binding protein with RPS1 domain
MPRDYDADDRPRHRKRAPKAREKKYGFEEWSNHFQKWMHARWYTTPRARDQALDRAQRSLRILKNLGLSPQFRKIER